MGIDLNTIPAKLSTLLKHTREKSAPVTLYRGEQPGFGGHLGVQDDLGACSRLLRPSERRVAGEGDLLLLESVALVIQGRARLNLTAPKKQHEQKGSKQK